MAEGGGRGDGWCAMSGVGLVGDGGCGMFCCL